MAGSARSSAIGGDIVQSNDLGWGRKRAVTGIAA